MLIYLYIFIQYHRSLIFCMFSDKFLHPHHIIPASKLVSALMKCTHHIILLSLNINKYIRMLIHRIFLQPQMCFLLISGHSSNKKSETSELMALFYLHRRHCWILQPPYIRGPHSACFLLISGLRCYSTYIVDTAGLHQPPYIRNPHLGAPCSYPDCGVILPTS